MGKPLSLYQVLPVIIDVLLGSLLLLDHHFLLGRTTLHVQAASSTSCYNYTFKIGSFFSLLRFLRFYSYSLLFLADSSCLSFTFFRSICPRYISPSVQCPSPAWGSTRRCPSPSTTAAPCISRWPRSETSYRKQS